MHGTCIEIIYGFNLGLHRPSGIIYTEQYNSTGDTACVQRHVVGLRIQILVGVNTGIAVRLMWGQCK